MMHQVKGEKMNNSLILLVIMISIVLPTVAEAKKHKVHVVQHVQVNKAKAVHHKQNKNSVKKLDKKPVKKSVIKKGKLNNNLVGIASWYGKNHHGKKTASGDIFNMNKLTAAHRRFPLGSKVKVTNLKNNRSTIVLINDRGPYVRGRIIDLSKGAAKAIGMDGVQRVSLDIIS
jgi:rare lipoprotein A